MVRIEIDRDELPKALNLEMFECLSREFKRIGFRFVAVDVDGYRTGALNGGMSGANASPAGRSHQSLTQITSIQRQ